MINKDSAKVTTTFQHYIVAYIDVLGQRAKLAKLEELLDNREGGEPVLEAQRQTIDVIKQLRNDFYEFLMKGMGSESKNQRYHNLTPEQKTQFKKLKYGDTKFRYVSDGIIIYTPLVITKGEQRVQDILSTVLAAAFLILRSLAYNVAIRGAIELGWATKLGGWTKNKEDADIYGPVLTRNHYLESQIAEYPRIIVGSRLVEYLNLRLKLRDEQVENPQEILNRICVEQCNGLICEDTDGQFIVDFLGDFMQEGFKSPNIAPLVTLGYGFVKEEYMKYKRARDSKMASRYARLMDYFLERLPNLDKEM